MRLAHISIIAAAIIAHAAHATRAVHAAQENPFQFVPHEVATGLRGGYQLVAADLNRDGRTDIIAIASGLTEIVWFQNPGWQRHVLASGLRAPINAAAADIDGDGIPELALVHGFATAAAQSTGNVSILTHSADVTQPWTIREIDRVPTSHRVRWVKPAGAGASAPTLINSPLIGATLTAPDYRGNTPLYGYRAPEWKRELISTVEEGVVHSIESDHRELLSGGRPGSITFYTAGFLGVGAHVIDANIGLESSRLPMVAGDPSPWPRSGASEVALGRLGSHAMLVTVEPWHGNNVVVYGNAGGGAGAGAGRRTVIDSTLTDAHTLLTADFDGDGTDEIVAGERGGSRSVRVYRSGLGDTWTRTIIDAGAMAAAGCVAADFNNDGRIDLACIGTATANVKWYENVKRGGED